MDDDEKRTYENCSHFIFAVVVIVVDFRFMFILIPFRFQFDIENSLTSFRFTSISLKRLALTQPKNRKLKCWFRTLPRHIAHCALTYNLQANLWLYAIIIIYYATNEQKNWRKWDYSFLNIHHERKNVKKSQKWLTTTLGCVAWTKTPTMTDLNKYVCSKVIQSKNGKQMKWLQFRSWFCWFSFIYFCVERQQFEHVWMPATSYNIQCNRKISITFRLKLKYSGTKKNCVKMQTSRWNEDWQTEKHRNAGKRRKKRRKNDLLSTNWQGILLNSTLQPTWIKLLLLCSDFCYVVTVQCWVCSNGCIFGKVKFHIFFFFSTHIETARKKFVLKIIDLWENYAVDFFVYKSKNNEKGKESDFDGEQDWNGEKKISNEIGIESIWHVACVFAIYFNFSTIYEMLTRGKRIDDIRSNIISYDVCLCCSQILNFLLKYQTWNSLIK